MFINIFKKSKKIKVMKRKFMKIAFVVAIAIVSGINVFNAQKPEVLSDIAMENVEALAQTENPNSTIIGECWRSYVVITECQVVCPMCGTAWLPNIRQPYSIAQRVSGSCGECGNTLWDIYN